MRSQFYHTWVRGSSLRTEPHFENPTSPEAVVWLDENWNIGWILVSWIYSNKNPLLWNFAKKYSPVIQLFSHTTIIHAFFQTAWKMCLRISYDIPRKLHYLSSHKKCDICGIIPRPYGKYTNCNSYDIPRKFHFIFSNAKCNICWIITRTFGKYPNRNSYEIQGKFHLIFNMQSAIFVEWLQDWQKLCCYEILFWSSYDFPPSFQASKNLDLLELF